MEQRQSDMAEKPGQSENATCLVCGDAGARMHYGVSACLGCKGFFRRALRRASEYECLRDKACIIDKLERNSCRSCRLQKCLRVGMDPAAVQPDRDFTIRQRPSGSTIGRRMIKSKSKPENAEVDIVKSKRCGTSHNATEWIMRLPVDVRTMLMNLLNIEAKVAGGDTSKDASEIYPLGIDTIREIIGDPTKLLGRRTEVPMRYEPYRMARNEELSIIVYRRLIAAIDWVEALAELIDGGLAVDDRIALVKCAFGPLALFKASAKTAIVTDRDDLLCQCNFAYVPRNIAKAYSDTYHLDNGLVARLIDQLVRPFRRIHLRDEEVVCLSAIIALNSMAKDLSTEAAIKVNVLRERISDTLFQIVRESRKNECPTPAPQFGNLLLYLPIVTDCANSMNENLRFAQTFSPLGGIPLLTSLFGCFSIEPFLEGEFKLAAITKEALYEEIASTNLGRDSAIVSKNVGTQTDANRAELHRYGLKRRLPIDFTSPVEDDSTGDFQLLQPPCSYTLTEMFDDRANNDNTFNCLTPNLVADMSLLTPTTTITVGRAEKFSRPLVLRTSWSSGDQPTNSTIPEKYDQQYFRPVNSLPSCSFQADGMKLPYNLTSASDTVTNTCSTTMATEQQWQQTWNEGSLHQYSQLPSVQSLLSYSNIDFEPRSNWFMAGNSSFEFENQRTLQPSYQMSRSFNYIPGIARSYSE